MTLIGSNFHCLADCRFCKAWAIHSLAILARSLVPVARRATECVAARVVDNPREIAGQIRSEMRRFLAELERNSADC